MTISEMSAMPFGPYCEVSLCTILDLSTTFIVHCVAAEYTGPGHIRKRLHFLSPSRYSWVLALNDAQNNGDK